MEGAWRVHRGCMEGAWRVHGGCMEGASVVWLELQIQANNGIMRVLRVQPVIIVLILALGPSTE